MTVSPEIYHRWIPADSLRMRVLFAWLALAPVEPGPYDFEPAPERWRDAAKRDECWCAATRKPCVRHDGWQDGWDARGEIVERWRDERAERWAALTIKAHAIEWACRNDPDLSAIYVGHRWPNGLRK